MKTLFIEARKKLSSSKEDINAVAEKLPAGIKKVGLVASLQYIDLLRDVKAAVIKSGKEVYTSKGILTCYTGQVLGCDVHAAEKIIGKVDAFLFIGQSRFHALQIALIGEGKPVFIWQPESGVLNKISSKEVAKLKAQKKAALIKFLAAKKAGILVSVKPGQNKMKEALEIKKKLEKKGKEAFIFLTDNINLQELENFDSKGEVAWLNTACPALNMEPKVLNLEDLMRVKYL